MKKVDEKTDEGAISIKNILDACRDGNIENFRFHLKSEIGERKKLLEISDENGLNVLHHAARGGNLNIFEVLLSENMDICQRTNEQLTVLHIASKYGKVDICRCIFENEYFNPYHNAVSSTGKNACHFAAEGGSVELLQLLISKNISAEMLAKENQNIFHYACIYNQLDMCKFIAQQYPDFVNAENVDKWNAVMFAAKYGHVQILQFLHENKNSLTSVSESNRTALNIACDHGHIDACKYLVETCLSLLATVDHKGRHFVAAKGKNSGNEIEILELLLNADKKVDIKGLTSKGNSVLTLAIKYNEYDFAEYLFKNHANLLHIPGVNKPRETGNEDPDMKILLNRYLP